MATDQIDETVLEGATRLHDLFARSAAPAIVRRVAWALDCGKVDEAMYWLQVLVTLYGQPVDDTYLAPSA